ncbi:AI-2E family transporter YdiK [Caenimonas terrae]|uniref:AI-2E family transporter YdiK n=1 Tax=Caenimonas terrae TaxID=696074 RepID=A0ABW0NI42_9BURK
MAEPRGDLTRTLLSVIFLGGLVVASLTILRPFIAAAIWAAMIAVATWPMLLWFQGRLWKRRWLAIVAMAGVLMLVFAVPLALAIGTIVLNAQEIVAWVKSMAAFTMPAPPAWISHLPVIGPKVVAAWEQVATSGIEGLLARILPYGGQLAQWGVAEAGNLGILLMQFLLTLALTMLFYASGEAAGAQVLRFGRRLAGERGENAVLLAAQAIRSIALGVVVTAAVQAALSGIGLGISGIRFAGLLTAVVAFLCIAQVGPSPVLIPAVIWLYWSGETGWGTFLLVWTLAVVTLDNVLRPLLIKRGADLPLLLVFAGVVGGLLAFGLVGVFVGPVVLAVAYTLLRAWIADDALRR